jgi:phosphate:Na+ symporter
MYDNNALMPESSGIQNFGLENLIGVVGGLAVFLLGLDMMSANLRKAAGNTFKLILEKATDNRAIGVLVGTLVTAVIQSSSATTSILISLVQSQLISFERSIAVILGANIGTTITGQIIAFKVTKYALIFVALGFLFKILSKRTRTKNFAYIIIGLGFIFLGLETMSQSMAVLRNSTYFVELMQSFENVGYGILAGAIFTALVQSSSASIGIAIGLATQGLISIEAAVPLILGANIGTCITAVLASINTGSAAKRVATAHILFNISGVLLFAFWVPDFIKLVKVLTLDDGNIPRLMANAQTAFNVIATLIWFPLIGVLDKASCLIIKEDINPQKVKYYFPRVSGLSQSAELLFIQSNDAIKNYKNVVKEMLWLSRDFFIKKEKDKEARLIEVREYQVEFRTDILNFLSRIVKQKLDFKDVSKALNLVSLVNEIEHVAFKLESSLVALDHNVPAFDEKYIGLEEYFIKTVKCYSKACNAVMNDSYVDSQSILEKLDELKAIEEELRNKSVEDLTDGGDYESEKLNLWVLEFIRSVNATSRRICNIVKLSKASR